MSDANDLITLERDGDVAVLRLNDPARLNPISIPLQERLRDALAEVREDRSLRALVVTGAGKAFCVGADLKSMGATEANVAERASQMMTQLSNPLILAIRDLPIPVVSAVNGAAAGAGVGIALAADVVLMARSAYFYLPFLPRLGIVPDLGTTWFLERLVGRSRATAMSLLGERLSAEQAAQWGLAWACVDDAALQDEALATARRLATLPAHAARETRRAFDAAERHTLAEQLAYEADRQRELIDLPSFAEGVAAFLGKRDPVFPAVNASHRWRLGMLGLMQDRPLLISSLIDHAAAFHGATEIVTRTVEGPIHRSNWTRVQRRSKQVANAMAQLGIRPGDRVATLAWNTYRHLELYYGVSGSGGVLHTVNPRLFPEQIDYIVNHAEDKVLFFDIGQAPLVAKLAPNLKTVTTYVAMTDRAHMPDVALPNLLCYEELVGAQSETYDWPDFDERSASSLCYTSGTTGNPKGVLYSHRSTVLHTLMQISADGFGIHPGTSLLLIVPMFHANAWGVPYAAAMTGAKIVMPGPHLDGQNLYELMRDEHVTLSQGVPTVWMLFLQFLDAHPEIDPRTLDIERICCGGSATPRAMIDRLERDFDADWMQGWGMTETSPLGTIGKLLPKHAALSPHDRTSVKMKQGRGVWGVELKIVGADGNVQPHDGVAFGHLYVRGPWIAKAYFKGEGGDVLDEDGFFPTGDIATIDADGYVQLVDRAKDVIKSGGEWISSIELEDAANGHPAVAEAAIIGIPHPTWQERPLLVVVKRPGHEVTREALLDFLATRVAKWWLPDDVVFVAQLPHTATGKLLKTKLREQFRDHRLGQGDVATATR